MSEIFYWIERNNYGYRCDFLIQSLPEMQSDFFDSMNHSTMNVIPMSTQLCGYYLFCLQSFLSYHAAGSTLSREALIESNLETSSWKLTAGNTISSDFWCRWCPTSSHWWATASSASIRLLQSQPNITFT